MVLIHPPVSRPCEPPAGLARLAGALKVHGRQYIIIDANMEGIMSLIAGPVTANDTWTRRASLHLKENLSSIRSSKAFKNIGSYTKAVTEISRILEVNSQAFSTRVSLNNFQHDTLSPVCSADLVRSSEHPEENVFFSYFENRLSSLMEEHAPRIVGFSLNFLSQALTTFAMIGFLKRLSKGIKIIVGGSLVTSWMKRPGRGNPFSGLVDELVIGPGEGRILALTGVECCNENTLPDYRPFWHYDYLSPGRVLPFSTSWGCYWGKCSFCPEKAEGNRYSGIPAGHVPTQLHALTDMNLPDLIHVTDNAMSPALLTAMARHEPKAPWYGFARFTHHLTDPDFCSALKKSGCVMLQLGLESGDQAVIDELGKGIRLNKAAMALAALHDAGIATYVYILFGTPAENEQGARKTLAFVAAHAESIDFLNISIFNLPRGSIESKGLETYEFFDGDLCLYQGFVHPGGWDRKKVRQFLDKEFKRHPAIARIVRNDPPYFTSNHAPFFAMNSE
ncbi:MAG: radical SAM protein [Desulfomonilia bacterium]